MFTITGLLAIPSDPQKQIVESNGGYFVNFKGTTQGRTVEGKPEYHYWNCSVWVNKEQLEKWENDYLSPGNVLYIETAHAQSFATQDGKHHFTKIKLEHYKTKKLSVPLWYSGE